MGYSTVGRDCGGILDTSVKSPMKGRVQVGTTYKSQLIQDFFEEVGFRQSFPKELMSKLRLKDQGYLTGQRK